MLATSSTASRKLLTNSMNIVVVNVDFCYPVAVYCNPDAQLFGDAKGTNPIALSFFLHFMLQNALLTSKAFFVQT